MTNTIRPQDEPLLHQLQSARHELASARADVLAKQLPPPAFGASMLAALEAVANSELTTGEASRELRVALLSKRADEWSLEDLEQLLARIDASLVELVKPA